MNEEFDFSEDELIQAFQARPTPPTPSEIHLEALETKLLAQTRRPAAASPPSPGTSLLLIRRLFPRWVLLSLAVLVGLGMLAVLPRASTASAQLSSALDATRNAGWVHSTTVVEFAGEAVESEAWCSPSLRIVAFRSPQRMHLVNYAEGIQSSYTEKSGQVYRWRADRQHENSRPDFLHALLSDGDLAASFPRHEVSHLEKQLVEIDGQQRTRISFELQGKDRPAVRSKTVVLVDPASNRLHSWEQEHANGSRVTTTFDFPATGPQDIYQLGASREAKVIDRVASSDVVELSEQYQREVHHFENYTAVVIDRLQSEDGQWLDRPLLRRIQRTGPKFRVDLLTPHNDKLPIPDVPDRSWWQAHREQFDTTALADCEGEFCTLYPVHDERLELATELPRPHRSVSRIPVLKVKTDRGSTTVPVWPTLWPEYACRPMLITSSPTLQFDLEPSPAEEYPNSLRLRILVPGSSLPQVRSTWWLSLDHDRCVARSIRSRPNFDDFTLHPVEVTSEFSRFEHSLSGIVYATRRTTSTSRRTSRQVTDFIVDFEQSSEPEVNGNGAPSP